MIKKYELTQDLPDAPAGRMFERVDSGDISYYYCKNYDKTYAVGIVENNPTWFKPIITDFSMQDAVDFANWIADSKLHGYTKQLYEAWIIHKVKSTEELLQVWINLKDNYDN